MEQGQTTILVVDDEPLNLTIICEYLESADNGYHWDTATDGAAAWALLEQNPERYQVILLDRMMPQMDGMEVLSRIRRHPRLREIPVILQTARAARDDIQEGIAAGAYYYLTKPFQERELISIVQTAVHDRRRYLKLQQELERNRTTLGLLQSCRFLYRTLDEARNLATLLAQTAPTPETVITGLSELLINAVEHGNLGIGYDEKSRLNETGSWEQEIERRLALPAYRHKWVEVILERQPGEIQILISDQGQGFDCTPYLEISAERGADNHGRGIALARMISFARLEYLPPGNRVRAVIADPASARQEAAVRTA